MLIFAGVDGTGPRDQTKYAQEFAKSHVKTLYNNWPSTSRFYIRGPNDEGLSTKQRGDAAATFIKNLYKTSAGPNRKIFVYLSGYSRGGAAVIDACWTLKYLKIPVTGLFLFDAVDRTNTISSADNIPGNVASCYHAFRDPYAFSRNWFGNCGRSASNATTYTEKMFFGTHGALGGCPWKTSGTKGAIVETNSWINALDSVNPFSSRKVAGTNNGETGLTPALDAAASQKVWSWMTGHITSETRNANLVVNAASRNVKYENVMTIPR
jgi:hypothetical protein